jgi:hypothetical protein
VACFETPFFLPLLGLGGVMVTLGLGVPEVLPLPEDTGEGEPEGPTLLA